MNSFEKTIAATLAATGISTTAMTGLPTQGVEAQMYQRQTQITQEYRPDMREQYQCPSEHYNYNRQCTRSIQELRRHNMAEHNRQTLDRVNQHNQNADRIRQERNRIEQYRHQRRQMQPQHSQPQYQHPYNDRVIIRIINGRQVIQYIQGY